MIQSILKRCRSAVVLCVFAINLSAMAEEPAGALPLTVFKNLEAGKQQTVVAYGTSLTHRAAWVRAMKDYFEETYPGQVTVINTARSGMHSDWGVENLRERVLEKEPDLVFMEFSANDAKPDNGVSLQESRRNLDRMVDRLRKRNREVDIVVQTMNPAWDSPRSAPKEYASDRPELAKFYEVYREYTRENDLPLADHEVVWRRIMEEEPERFRKMVPDGIHPSSTSSLSVTWAGVKAMLEEARGVVGGGGTAGMSGAAATLGVWPDGKMPGDGAREPEGARPPKGDGFHRITNVSRPTLSFYPAPKADAPAPMMIVCPGGGYSYVVVDKEGSEIARWLNSNGISAAVLKYRVPNNRTGALQDLQRSLRLVRNRADEWNIDPQRVGVIGFSAGGHLSARASTRFADAAYGSIDEVDRKSCRPDLAVLAYPAYLDGREGGVTADLDLEADIPPTLIVHSEDDRRFILGSKLYAAALGEVNARHDFLLYETGGHGYGLHCKREAREWPEAAARWLKRNRFR